MNSGGTTYGIEIIPNIYKKNKILIQNNKLTK